MYIHTDLDASDWNLEYLEMLELSDNKIGGEQWLECIVGWSALLSVDPIRA